MIPAVYDRINGKPDVNSIFYHGKFKEFHGLELNVIMHYLHRAEQRIVFVSPSPSSQFGVVPFELRDEIPEILQKNLGYEGPIRYLPSLKLPLAYEINTHLN